MRIVDFLTLLGGTNQQIIVQYEYGANRHGKKTGIVDQVQFINLSTLEIVDAKQPQIYLTAADTAKPKHLWELILLLKQHNLQRFMYVRYGEYLHPLFGYRIGANKLLLA
ncbi:hypothetical protein [Loigolactobacillus backii]|uniref:Uncharacterized protein n=1 Tax=Loigolactobacillus backii TaxID=375175 RepID=A0A192H4W4_9LACO|nr:hypothetical protein [Loigolactobacillus backii]ANK63016.1 hypothetical protein AYR53_09730 [Loigolactobacillus backii]ANK69976.1 hypothetical protein AYR56_07275 [Loigolactobacillus backii]MDA5388561.1 hypothetical protein [Loigolactobacillus backii]MDA5391015.1 hypothetical protein [Loigolactobacillus backii]PIO83317.1 hypothetical protein BSQ39_07000 [Loigolactobacillus backii]